MLERLVNKLQNYIIEHNPELLLQLQEEKRLTAYLQDKLKSIEKLLWQLQESEAPDYTIEEILIETLTADLKPSRFDYICTLLQEEFPDRYEALKENGTLTYEGVNLVTECASILDSTGFSAGNESSPVLYQVIKGIIHQYFQNN